MKALPRAVVVGMVVVGASLPVVRAGADQAVPFSDPNAKGFLALCDEKGHAVTSGRLDAQPFVWKAVSSFAPPSGYLGKGENAALTIYQARRGVDPGEWNGDQLTGASYFTNPKLPAAQATYADLPLSVIVHEFPPMWDGLYQLRMVFAKTSYGNYSVTYPATVIKVTGNTWQVVQGGNLPCGATRSVSNESFLGIGKKPAAATPTTPSDHAASNAPLAAQVRGATVSTARPPHHGDFPLGYVLLAVFGALAAAVTAARLLRRRSPTHFSPDSLGIAGDDRDAVISGRTSVR